MLILRIHSIVHSSLIVSYGCWDTSSLAFCGLGGFIMSPKRSLPQIEGMNVLQENTACQIGVSTTFYIPFLKLFLRYFVILTSLILAV